MGELLCGYEMKWLGLSAFVAAQHGFQMVQAFFNASLFESLQEDA